MRSLDLREFRRAMYAMKSTTAARMRTICIVFIEFTTFPWLPARRPIPGTVSLLRAGDLRQRAIDLEHARTEQDEE